MASPKSILFQEDNDLLTRVIEINGKKYTSGLLWQPLTSASGRNKEVVKFAKEQNMNIAVIYSGLALQAGYAAVPPKDIKKYAGTYCLATVLASLLGESWLGLFDLDNGLSVIAAVYDGKIVPGCDAIGTREQMRAMAGSMMSMYDWERLYVPDDSITDGAPSHLLERVSKKKLQDILTLKRIKREFKIYAPFESHTREMLIGLVLVALGVGGWYGYNWYKVEVSQKQKLAAEMAMQASKNQKRASDREKALEELRSLTVIPPWVDKPNMMDAGDSCGKGLSSIPAFVGGWKLREAICADSAITLSYGRVLGLTMLDFKESADKLKKDRIIVDYSLLPDNARVTIRLPDLKKRQNEELISMDEYTMKWVSYFQAVNGILAEMKLIPPPKPPVPKPWIKEVLGEKQSEVKPPWWTSHAWKINSASLPVADVLRSIPRAPGFVLKKITLNAGDGNLSEMRWTAEGELHVKP